jgi:hypothetical protein
MTFDPNADPVDGTEDFYNVNDLQTRVSFLEQTASGCSTPMGDGDCDDDDCPLCNPARRDELNGLRELLDDASLGLHYQTLYRDSYMADYAEDYARDVAGNEAVSLLDSYVNWDSFAGDLASDMPEYKISGHTYHAR